MGKIVTTTNLSELRQRQPRLSKTLLSLAVATAFSAGTVSTVEAAGLGRLTVQSALGQPLKAQVEVTSLTEGEAGSLTAKLASSDAFRQAGLEFNPALTSLRFKINRTGNGRALVEISSTRPINEPFVDLLVELNWATGKFVREYTFLLDPPELRLGRDETVAGGQSLVTTPAPSIQQPVAQAQPQPVQVAPAPAPVAASPAPAASSTLPPIAETVPLSESASTSASASASASAPVVVTESPQLPPVASPAPAITETITSSSPVISGGELPGSVQVARGDTLGDIARGLALQGATLDQAIVAIYRANPDAFFGSVHQLRAGRTLVIPSAGEMAALSQSEVRTEMRASNDTWREYRARLAAASQTTANINASAPSGSAAVGEIATAPTDTSAATPEGDQLKLSREGTGSETAAGGATSAEEDSFARDAALQDAQSRVTELERNVKDLQRLLELKNTQLADLSDQLSTAETAVTTAATAGVVTDSAGSDTASTDTPATQPLDTVAAAGDAAADATTDAAGNAVDAVTDAAGSATDAATGAVDAVTDAASGAVDSATDAASSAVDAATTAASGAADAATDTASGVADAATGAASTATDAVTDASSGIMGKITSFISNPMIAGAGAGLLALLGGLFFWKRRRNKQDEADFEDTLATGPDDAFAANSLFGTTGGQDVDTSASNSLFNTASGSGTTVGEETSVDVHSTEVDPIAEAEVYIAYGREAQAEEILKEALKRQPDRQAIRLKLLEIYAGRKDATAYGGVAREMYDATNGQNEEWPKVITMGLSIDPTNALYTGEGEDLADPTTMSGPATAAVPDTQSGISGGVAAAAAGVAGAGAAGASALVDALSSPTEVVDSAPDTHIAPATSTADELASLDFDLDISTEMETHDTIAADTEMVSGGGSEAALNDALSDNIDMPSLDMDTAIANPGTMADLNPDTSVDTIATKAVEDDVDLSAIGLDLEPSGGGAPAGSDPARWQEMATKLDLASAYEEIGDKEGARELLDEVIKGGDNSQQQKAQTMLAKLA